MSTPLAVGQLLLGTADLPGVSSIASAVAESAAQDKIPWSALEYSGQTITSISGSAIGGQVDTSQFYPTSNPSGFITGVDLSDYAKESSLSSVSSVVSSIQEDVSSISGQISGLTGVYLEQSASSLFAPSGNYLSATDSGNFYPMTGNPSSFVQSGELSAYAKESSVSGKLDASASSLFAPSGDYAFNSSVSGKLDASASSLFAPSGDYAYNSALSGYIPTSASSSFMPSGDYQTAGDYAYNSAVSSKLDASASSDFLLASASGDFLTAVTTDETLSGNGTTGSALGVVKMDLTFDTATMTVSALDGSATVGVRDGVFFPSSAIQIVTYSSEATANNVIYIVTGTP